MSGQRSWQPGNPAAVVQRTNVSAPDVVAEPDKPNQSATEAAPRVVWIGGLPPPPSPLAEFRIRETAEKTRAALQRNVEALTLSAQRLAALRAELPKLLATASDNTVKTHEASIDAEMLFNRRLVVLRDTTQEALPLMEKAEAALDVELQCEQAAIAAEIAECDRFATGDGPDDYRALAARIALEAKKMQATARRAEAFRQRLAAVPQELGRDRHSVPTFRHFSLGHERRSLVCDLLRLPAVGTEETPPGPNFHSMPRRVGDRFN